MENTQQKMLRGKILSTVSSNLVASNSFPTGDLDRTKDENNTFLKNETERSLAQQIKKQSCSGNIFYRNINNNKYKLIPFNLNLSSVGNTKYSPPASKEWKNNVYFFNYNNVKNLPFFDIKINKLIKGYFNLSFNPKVLKTKQLHPKRIRASLNRIFVSKAEVKHTNSKAIITVYTYNREKKTLLKKFFLIKKLYTLKRGLLSWKPKRFPWTPSTIDILKEKQNRLVWYKGKKILFKTRLLLLKRIWLKDINYIFNRKNYKFLSNIRVIKDLLKIKAKKELLLIKRFKFKLNLNKYKFQEKLLYRLSKLISKLYNKKVEFNIINLKSFVLNSDIFTEILTRQLRRRRFHVIRMVNGIIGRAPFPFKNTDINAKNFVRIKNIDLTILQNKFKNLNLNSLVFAQAGQGIDRLLEGNNNSFAVDKVLNELYYNVINDNNNISPSERDYSKIKDIIFNSIKYKNLGGLRIEVRGRLTKRYRADRAIYIVQWKDGLKNKDASLRRLPSVMFRGWANSNVEYSIQTSKRRVGSFAVKGWISGK
jgi:hypothetical protein